MSFAGREAASGVALVAASGVVSGVVSGAGGILGSILDMGEGFHIWQVEAREGRGEALLSLKFVSESSINSKTGE